MIRFSLQRLLDFLRAQKGLICLLIFSMIQSLSNAQTAEQVLRGSWIIDAPESGGLIVIVKREGRASYFWAETPERTVRQGTWSFTANGKAVFNWQDGSSHSLQLTDSKITARFTPANGGSGYTTTAQKLPKDALGQWAKPPATQNTDDTERDQATGFFGIWKIESSERIHYFTVEPDRSAASTYGFGLSGSRGLRGEWARQGSELHIAWDSGHYSILRESERGFRHKMIEPGVIIETDQTEFDPVSRTRLDNLPTAWQELYETERKSYTGGIMFASRKKALRFYRGDWLVRLSEKSFEKVDIGRFGGLSTSRSKDLGGDWLINGQDVFMRWDDGMRKILGPIGLGFIVYEFKPGRPLDGIPTRLLPAAPVDTKKLTKYLDEREVVVEKMRELAATAGVQINPVDKGVGNTFMRWAWPFGGDDIITDEDLILAESLSSESYNDPWWWPFWSENRSADTSNDEVKVEPVSENATTVASAQEDDEPKAPAKVPDSGQKKNNPKKKTWYWPY